MGSEVRSMQAMRGIAAWMVVFGHSIIFLSLTFPMFPLLRDLPRFTNSLSNAGVDLFFVISGTIMVIVTARRRHDTALVEAADFLARRLLRIYPLLWLSIVIRIPLGRPPYPANWQEALTSFSLFVTPPEYPPAWTLTYEVRFYVLVALVVLIFRNKLSIGLLALGAGLVFGVFLASHRLIWPETIVQPLMVEFVFGLIAGTLYLNRVVVAPKALLIGGIAWFTTTLAFVAPNVGLLVNDYRILGFGLPASMILYGAMTLEREGRLRLPDLIVRSGDSSYSVYLFHYTVLEVMSTKWSGTLGLGAVGYFASSIAITAIIGQISFRLVERPLIALAHYIPWGRNRNHVFYATRFNSAVDELGVEQVAFDRDLRLRFIDLGRRKMVPPRDMAVMAVAQLPILSRGNLDPNLLRAWAATKKINVKRPEMRNALEKLSV